MALQETNGRLHLPVGFFAVADDDVESRRRLHAAARRTPSLTLAIYDGRLEIALFEKLVDIERPARHPQNAPGHYATSDKRSSTLLSIARTICVSRCTRSMTTSRAP